MDVACGQQEFSGKGAEIETFIKGCRSLDLLAYFTKHLLLS